MPTEIRRQIFTELLGNRQLHIDHTGYPQWEEDKKGKPRGDWKHTVCDIPWQGVEEYYKIHDEDGYEPECGENTILDRFQCHESCHAHGRRFRDYYGMNPPHTPSGDWEHLDLRALRSCRQIYDECNQILWASNVLYFEDPLMFARFIRERTVASKTPISRLYLIMGQTEVEAWRKILTPTFVRSLAGLRDLHLAAAARFPRSRVPSLIESSTLLSAHMNFISVFSILHLSHVHVRLLHNWAATSESWTKIDRRRMEDRLQKLLLAGGTPTSYYQQVKARRDSKTMKDAFRL